MSTYFSDKKIWITGASSGLGEHLAYALAKEGAQLVLSARRLEELERVKKGCENPDRVQLVPFDLSSEKSVLAAFDVVQRSEKAIDILFNNGGISQRSEALQTKTEVEREIFEINYFSNILLSKLVAREMIKKKSGHLVIISSLLGKWGFHTRSSYAASKHALHGYYDSMRMELENQGLSITIVTPGFLATNISKNARNTDGDNAQLMDNNQANGLSAKEAAIRIMSGVSQKKNEFAVGSKEILGLKMRRFFPKWFEKILRKQSPT
jgi:dehydrogenase/reductase SDR family member 7B